MKRAHAAAGPLEREDLEKFICSLDEYQPAIPDELIRHHLSRAGFQTDDPRIERLISLATQKFIADIANDAICQSRLRAASGPAPRKAAAIREPKIVLTLDDLERALREYGVHLRKPPYFADSVDAGAPEVAVPPLNNVRPVVHNAAQNVRPAAKPVASKVAQAKQK